MLEYDRRNDDGSGYPDDYDDHSEDTEIMNAESESGSDNKTSAFTFMRRTPNSRTSIQYMKNHMSGSKPGHMSH